MSDDTTNEDSPPEDNELIKDLRSKLKVANASIKTAGADAIALVERGTKAAGLMPEGFKGVADIYATEVDGELTADNATEWLKGRGFTASPDKEALEEANVVSQLEAVTDLGSAVAAAGSLSPQDAIIARLEELKTSNEYKTLPEYTAAIEKILEG